MPPKKINLKSQKEKEEKKEDKETVLEKKNSKIIKVDKIDDKTSKKKISIIKSKKTINEPIIEDIKETKDNEEEKETKDNEEEKETKDNEEEDEVQEDNEEEDEVQEDNEEEDEVQEDNEEEDEVQEDKNKKIISKAKPIIKKDKKTLEKEENQKNHNHSKPKTISISTKVDNKVDMFEEDDLDFRYVMMNYDFTKNKSEPKITKYEKALLIGKRAKQIEEGANPNVKYQQGQSVISIAEEELKQRKIPFFIRRTIGNKIEYWKPADMEVNMN